MFGIKNTARRIRRRVSRTWDKKVLKKGIVNFLHIGKTGGTAIRVGMGGHVRRKSDVRTEKYRIIFHRHNVTLEDIPKGQKVFFFVRDPVSRFVSGFYSRKRKGKPRIYSDWSEQEKNAFDRFKTPNELAVSLTSKNKSDKLSALRAMDSIQHIRNKYSKWYISKDYFIDRLDDIIMVGRTEHLDFYFSQLKKILKLPENAHLPSDPVKSHSNPYYKLDTALEEKAKRNIISWYVEDYEFLNLCKRYSNELKYRD